ncbi:MAG: TIGR00730 family Rossman fold protein [Petrimonas sp.]|nr:TIGR00730 family Rossman fold protein [Petrimonas sp.]
MQNEENSSGVEVVVYCASSSNIDREYVDAATNLGHLFAENNITCITGAGFKGLMGAINYAVIEKGGKAKGIIPRFMVDNGWCHANLTETIITETIHERKAKMAELSDAAVALPGGVGTLEELLEIITWKQLRLYENPIIILNVNGFYDPLIEMLTKIVDQKFMHPIYREMWKVVDTPEEVIENLRNFKPWNPKIDKFDKKVL